MGEYERIHTRGLKTSTESTIQNADKEALSNSVTHDFSHAEELLSNDQWDEAISLYDRVIGMFPKNALALYGRARCYERKDDYSKALRDIEAALQIEQENIDFFYFRGFLYAGINEYEKAITDATTVLKQNPNHYEAHYLRGLSFYGLGRYIESLYNLSDCKELQDDLNLDPILNLVETACTTIIKGVRTKELREALEAVIDKALIVPVLSMETIQEAYTDLKSSWKSKKLFTGSLEEISFFIQKNISSYASRLDFIEFDIVIDRAYYVQLAVILDNSFIGIRVWRSEECFCVCGNSNFKVESLSLPGQPALALDIWVTGRLKPIPLPRPRRDA